MFPPCRVGPQVLSDGALSQERTSKDGAVADTNTHCSYQESVYRGNVFSMTLAASTGTIAAGNIVAGAAAAVTQFALGNPTASGKHLVLLRFRLGIISSGASGMPVGPVFHGYQAGVPTLAPSGTILNNLMSAGGSSVARGYTSAAGAALTGGAANVTLMCANFATTLTTQASPYLVSTDDLIDGSILIAPGFTYVPMFQGAGTTVLFGMSLTWEEISL